MIINDVQFNCSLEDILTELVSQLRVNNIPLIAKQRDSGDHIQITCPYHSNGMERKPSAGLRKSDGIFHCFACGEIHTLPEVISHCFGHDEDLVGTWGWAWLLKNFAITQVEERKDVDLDFSRNSVVRNRSVYRNQFVTEEELDKYRYIHPYMKKRGLTDEVIERFDIGFDFDTNCITFPVRDIKGNVLFIARRSVHSKFFNYPSLSEKSVYGLFELYSLDKFPDEIWITESMIDALRLWGVGIYACALNGLGSSNQYKQLSNMPCRVFVLATDMDNAGLNARQNIRENVKNKLFMQVFLPNGRKDIGECTDEEILALRKVF